MLSPIKTIGLIGVFLCLTISSSNCACPKKGKVGGKSVPDVLSLVKNQNGFSATIEIITPEETLMITEKYNGAKKYGSIEIDKISQDSIETHYYYTETNEKFVIKNDECKSSNPAWDEKWLTVDAWMYIGLAKSVDDLYGKMNYLGPTSLMIWAKNISDKAQYVGKEDLDGVNTDHWYYCLFSGGLEIDWWLDSSTKIPFRFRFNNTRSTEVFNFLKFEPLQPNENDLLTYPIGYGCKRRSEDRRTPVIPKIFSEDTFSVDMEARVMYTNPDRVTVSSNRMTKYQETYSFEITDEQNSTRIIQNPKHLGLYIVNAETGECRPELFPYSQTNADNLAITWPYSRDIGFNLMNAIFTNAGYFSSYMGQVSTELGVMDVWEESLRHFFSKDGTDDAWVTYYFPAIDRTQNPSQAPSKIVLKPINKESISMSQPIPSQIEIIFIDYQTDKIKIFDQFDVSGCYDGPGEFIWFQIVMPDPDVENHGKSLVNTIREYFKDQLATFIPVLRTPEIIINLYESKYYVTVKLLDRPSFDFIYPEEGKFKITNPTSVLTKDNLEDCADACIDINCYSISYCSDSTCQIFNFNETMIELMDYEKNDQCSYHEIIEFFPDESIVGRNVRASTNNILNQIKLKVDAGEFMIPEYSLSANNFYVVNGPEEIGKIKEKS